MCLPTAFRSAYDPFPNPTKTVAATYSPAVVRNLLQSLSALCKMVLRGLDRLFHDSGAKRAQIGRLYGDSGKCVRAVPELQRPSAFHWAGCSPSR